MKTFTIELANPRGFCAGVDRAIAIVERALQQYGAPIYVRHEVVHNRYVVNDLKEKGAVFVDELHEVPDGSTVIFSAHGVARRVQDEARNRELKVLDATCPLVTKVHTEVSRYGREGKSVILVGHDGHPEVEGTMGQALGPVELVENAGDVDELNLNPSASLAYVTQTTLSVDDTARIIERLRERFPDIEGPRRDDICYATQNRQDDHMEPPGAHPEPVHSPQERPRASKSDPKAVQEHSRSFPPIPKGPYSEPRSVQDPPNSRQGVPKSSSQSQKRLFHETSRFAMV